MKIAIVGIGGVGGYYGGKLALRYAASKEHEVIFIARGQHLEAIKKSGLRLITPDGDYTAVPTAVTDRPEEVGPFDLVLFTVKGYGLEGAARQIAPYLQENSVVIPLLNGVDISDRLRTFFSKGIVLEGLVYISSLIEAPGQVRQVGGTGQLVFGPSDGNPERFRYIDEMFKQAGIKSELAADPSVPLWTKYIFICPVAVVTSLVQKPFGAVMADEQSKSLLQGLMAEVEQLARAKGVGLPQDIVEQSMKKVAIFSPETKSSMQLDYEKGRQTEIDIFSGYVVKAGKALGLKMPLHEKVYSALKKP